jgi:hypothetical protein
LLSTIVALSEDIETVVLKIWHHELSVYEEPLAERSSDRLVASTSRRDLPIVLAVEPITPRVRSPETKTTLSQVTSSAHTERESKPEAGLRQRNNRVLSADTSQFGDRARDVGPRDVLEHLRAENEVKLSVLARQASNVTHSVDPKLLVDVDSRYGNTLFDQRVTHETGTNADLEACSGTRGEYFCDLMPVAAPPRFAVIVQPVVVMGAGDLDLAHGRRSYRAHALVC